MSDEKFSPTAHLGRLPGLMCSTTGCKREATVDCMCEEHYDFYIKLHKAYVECLEYRTMAENALKYGLAECNRLRLDLWNLRGLNYELDEDELQW